MSYFRLFLSAFAGLLLVSEPGVAVPTPAPTPAPASYWLGQSNNTWSGENWAGTYNGTTINATINTPNSNSDITFSAPGANNTNTALDQNFTIKSLTVNSSAGIQGNKTLTITQSTNITSGTLTANSGVTISSNGSLTVGNGTFNLTNSGTTATFANSINIGPTAGTNGTVNVSGGNLTNTKTLTVGNNGTGTLNLSSGTASGQTTVLGSDVGGNGTLNVSGGVFSNSGSSFLIGKNGSGTLNLSNGTVSSVFGIMGNDAGSTGTANVTGGDWTNSNALAVGAGGNATLNLSNGTVSNTEGYVGFLAGATGTVNVTGGNWTNSVTLTVGSSGNGTVSISNGGRVGVGGGLVTLGALANATGTLNIGTYGSNSTAGALNATTITGGNGTAVINFNQSDEITFDPVITGSTSVNQLGNGTTLLSANSDYKGTTKVSAGALYINGSNLGATGNVTVAGGILGGDGATGGMVTVQSGGTITAGSNATSTGSLYGAGFALNSGSTALFQLGGTSSNSYDRLVGGGIFASGNITLSLQLTGSYTGNIGNSFKIFDFDEEDLDLDSANFILTSNLGSQFKWDLSRLTRRGVVFIAEADIPPATHWLGQTNNTWSGQNWASDAAGNATTATPTSTSNITFSATGANNTATVLDADTYINSLTVNSNAGIQGNNTLIIEKSTTVTAGELTLSGGVKVLNGSDSQIDGAGAKVTVTGNGTAWDVTSTIVNSPIFPPRLSVGVSSGNTGALNVLQGATVNATNVVVGENTGSSGNVTVNGAGSKLTTDYLSIGRSGNGTLNIQGGGEVVTEEYAVIAESDGSIGVATVTGAGSKWTIKNDLAIDSGGNGTLNILDGGSVSNRNASLATAAGLYASVTVNGTGSTWTNNGTLTVGDVGPATLTIGTGGNVSNTDGYVGRNAGSSGTANVSGGNWTSSGFLYVGSSGNGTLNLTSGSVSSAISHVGFKFGSNGTAVVSGGNWTNSGAIYVGSSGNGTLNLSSGTVSSTEGYLGQEAGSKGTANVSGGNWTNSADLFIGSKGSGTLSLSGGEVSAVNTLVGDNAGSTGAVNVTGGSLKTSGALLVGFGGNGTLSVEGGNVTVAQGITLGSESGSAGTLRIGNGTTTGTISASTISGGNGNATVVFNHNNPSLAFSPILTASLRVLQSGPGTTVLGGSNTYTKGTTIQAGTLRTASSNALGFGTVNLNGGTLAPTGTLDVSSLNWNGGKIALTLGTTVNAVNLVEGNLTVDEERAGAFVFVDGAGFATNTSYTILSAANMGNLSLSLFSGNTLLGIAPSFTINGNNLQVAFLQSGGNNMLHNSQDGVPTNDNFTTNGTVVSGLTPSGTIEPRTFIHNLFVPNSNLLIPSVNELNLSGCLTSTNSTITVNGTLNVAGNFRDPNSTINVNGALFVGGSTSIAGNSTLTVANSGVMTSLGGTTITDSTAIINGQLTSPQVTLNGGLLKGSGTITGNLFNNGTVNPGNSPGTLAVSGDYVQSASGALALEIASMSLFDRLIVGGVANLAGNLLVSNSGSPLKYGQRYAFLQAGSISGRFNQILMPDSSKLRGRFLAEEGTGSLLVAPASYTLVAQNANERRVARALNSFIPTTSGDRQAVSTALDLQSASQYSAAFQQIMPSFYQSLPQITIGQAFAQTQMINQRQSSVRLGASGFQAMGFEDQPLKYDKDGKSTVDAKDAKTVMVIPTRLNWSAWAMGTGIFSNTRNIQGVPNYRSQAGGFLAGADYAFGGRENGEKTFTAGVYGGYSYTYAEYASNSLTQANSALFGLYATYAQGGFYADAVVGGGYNAYRTRRSINFSTVDRTANSTPNGGQFNASLNLGYDWKAGGFTFGPIIGAQYTYAGTAPFTESGADSLDLRLSQQNVSSLQTTLGGRVAFNWNVTPSVLVIPEVRLFWQHEFLQNPYSIGASLDGGAGPGFNYVTDAPDRDSVFAGAGVTAQFGERWNSFVFYNISFGNQQNVTNSISAGLGWKF